MYDVKIGTKTLIGMILGFGKLDMKINDNIYSIVCTFGFEKLDMKLINTMNKIGENTIPFFSRTLKHSKIVM